jgi:hypothetical protein
VSSLAFRLGISPSFPLILNDCLFKEGPFLMTPVSELLAIIPSHTLHHSLASIFPRFLSTGFPPHIESSAGQRDSEASRQGSRMNRIRGPDHFLLAQLSCPDSLVQPMNLLRLSTMAS